MIHVCSEVRNVRDFYGTEIVIKKVLVLGKYKLLFEENLRVYEIHMILLSAEHHLRCRIYVHTYTRTCTIVHSISKKTFVILLSWFHET